MKTPFLATLGILALIGPAQVGSAQARPHRHPVAHAAAHVAAPVVSPAEAERVLAPLRQAATDCFAETVMSNPKAIGHARAGRWYEAAGVTGFLCRPEVGALIQAHDRLHGARTGERYFKGAYARHLDRQLAERLQPLLERKAVASAEPPPEKATEDGPAN